LNPILVWLQFILFLIFILELGLILPNQIWFIWDVCLLIFFFIHIFWLILNFILTFLTFTSFWTIIGKFYAFTWSFKTYSTWAASFKFLFNLYYFFVVNLLIWINFWFHYFLFLIWYEHFYVFFFWIIF